MKNKDNLSVSLNQEAVSTEEIKVMGMTCEHCKVSIETAVINLPGVISAMVDLAAKTLTITFDHNKSTLAQIKTEIEAIGFDVL